jgi:hypothetical protein
MQKNQEKFDTVMHSSTSHEFLCPVKQLAAVVNCILSYPGATDTPVSAVWRYDNIKNLTSKILINALCNAGFPRLQGQQNWHTLSLLWHSNVDVPGQMPHPYYHVSWTLVQQRHPAIHKKTD